ncbi:hypothetical protein [Sphingomonas sp. CARO-RG-8B-R24-01]|uniref:hypothetical protein n=1 Tax=Sphingomonas sp. CARO-RG-8B-R24-01 TaxID=2914831 RepID=UPI001F59699D|nr:hypothetical protein [Sphingomonas sp. CARO-RG-8B-R24-01]
MSINPFAGLMAGFRGASAEDEKSKDDDAARTAQRSAEDQTREEEDARRAEEDDRRQQEDARRAEEDGGSPDEKAKGEDDEQDPEADANDDEADAEEGMDDKESKAFRRGLAAGRVRENTRAGRIFLAAAAIGRPDLAATLAFTTRNSSGEASRIMNAAGAAPRPRGRLDTRMGNRPEPRPGAGAGIGTGGASKTTFADRVAAAVKKAGR